jgi:hypothetical protein
VLHAAAPHCALCAQPVCVGDTPARLRSTLPRLPRANGPQNEYDREVARGVWLALIVVGGIAVLAGNAASAPRDPQSSSARVVLADPDPELRHAMEQALAPWRLEVVIASAPPADAAMAQERADADTARFVVWRDGDQLVVYDRELGSVEQRDSSAGPLDPPTAAAAALTIKTMMRLPPPPPAEIAPPTPRVASDTSMELRLQAGVATRFAAAGDADMSMRFAGAALLRPWAGTGWRFGVAGDGGTAANVTRAGFKGGWSEWRVVALASWAYARGAWEIGPHAGAGVRRSRLSGTEMTTPREESSLQMCARAGVSARMRIARWTFGVAVDVDENFGTLTYSKTKGSAEIFQVPGTGVEVGAVIAIDL